VQFIWDPHIDKSIPSETEVATLAGEHVEVQTERFKGNLGIERGIWGNIERIISVEGT
jgi:hypothetical protein